MQQPGLDVFRLFNQVGLQVKRSTSGVQQPWVSTSPIEGDFYFAGAAPAAVAPPSTAPSTPAAAPVPPPTVVAGLARPLAPPALPVVEEPPDPRMRLLKVLENRPCSVLETRTVAGRLELSGLARPGPDLDAALAGDPSGGVGAVAQRGIATIAPRVDLLPPFACAPIELVAPAIRRMLSGGDRLLVLQRRVIAGGDNLAVTLQGVGTADVRIDVFGPAGRVDHVPIVRTAGSGPMQVLIPVGADPQGPRLVVALLGPLALAGSRPASEATSDYLAALRRAMPSGAGMRADAAVFDVQGGFAGPPPPIPAAAAPRPLTPAAPAKPARCAGIMERAQMGEAMSDAERAFLRSACR